MNVMPDEKKNVQITERISDTLHEQLRALAQADDRKLAAYVTRVLQKHVDSKAKKTRITRL